MWSSVVRYIMTDVSEKPIASIFSFDLHNEGIKFLLNVAKLQHRWLYP